MKLNLKGFKKVDSDDHHTTLKHSNGHMIKIAHKPLSDKMRKDLDALPTAMAEGGAVGTGESSTVDNSKKAPSDTDDLGFKSGPVKKMADGGEASADPMPTPAPQDATPSADDAPPPSPVVVNVHNAQPQPMATPVPTAPAQPVPVPVPVPLSQDPPAPQGVGSPQDPFGNEAYTKAYGQGLTEQKAGIYGEAQARAQQGVAEGKALDNAVQQAQDAKAIYQNHYNDLDTERKNFMSDIQNQHIDPQHYLNSMGTGAKIATSIGMILSGFNGAGAAGNGAFQALQTNINRDIDAQKAELGKKENLLSANLKQFGNLKDATEMTRAMQNDIVSMQLKKAAANATSALAKSQALQEAGKLDRDSAGVVSQLAMKKSLLQGLREGKIDPAKVVNMILPENQKAAGNKELADAQTMVNVRDRVLNAFDQIAALNTPMNKLNPQARSKIAGLIGSVVPGLSKDTAGKYTEADAKQIEAGFKSVLDNKQTVEEKRAMMDALTKEKMHPNNFPILSTYGIRPEDLGQYNNQGRSKFQQGKPVLKK